MAQLPHGCIIGDRASRRAVVSDAQPREHECDPRGFGTEHCKGTASRATIGCRRPLPIRRAALQPARRSRVAPRRGTPHHGQDARERSTPAASFSSPSASSWKMTGSVTRAVLVHHERRHLPAVPAMDLRRALRLAAWLPRSRGARSPRRRAHPDFPGVSPRAARAPQQAISALRLRDRGGSRHALYRVRRDQPRHSSNLRPLRRLGRASRPKLGKPGMLVAVLMPAADEDNALIVRSIQAGTGVTLLAGTHGPGAAPG